MSKKNLARTAIEGGRTGYSKSERYEYNRKVRANERKFVSKVTNDVDASDEIVIERRRVAELGFSDKIRPVHRWMDKQVGRVWNDVHSELRNRFDSRTTAGRHILFDHILADVDSHPNEAKTWLGYRRYFVDVVGILRKRDRSYYRWYQEKRTATDNALTTWRGDKYVREVGSEVFWVVSTLDKYQLPTGYRQDKKLSDAERKFYDSLTESEKRLVQVPVRE